MISNVRQKIKLQVLCSKIGSGVTPRGGENVYKIDGVSLVRSQNIYNYVFEYNGLAYIDDDQAEKMKNVEVMTNDVLLNITGDSVARCCIVPDEVLPARVNQHVSIIRSNSKLLNPRYLLYWINNCPTKELLFSLASTGGTRKALTKGMLENLKLEIPSINEQNTVAETLSCIDDKIELNNQINKNLEEMAQAIFKSWFVDFEPFQDGEFEDSELGRIPEGWSVVSLNEIMTYAGGSQPPAKEFINDYKEGYVRFIQIRDYDTDGHITYIPISHKNKLCDEKDILIARYGASLGRICFGLKGAYNVALAKVHPINENYREFLRCYLNSREFYIGINNKGGRSAQAGFNKGDIKSFKLAFPKTNELLVNFENMLSPLYFCRLEIKKQNNELCTIRDTLLPKLMSGEIRVPIEEVQ